MKLVGVRNKTRLSPIILTMPAFDKCDCTGDPNVILWALKPSEEGISNGVIARFWNVSDAYTTTDVTLKPILASATRTTHIETDIAPIDRKNGRVFSASFNKQQLQTFRLMLR